MERKQRSQPEWIAWVAVILAIAYPLSLGPAYWIVSRFKDASQTLPLVTAIYYPVIVTLIESPEAFRVSAETYLNLAAPKDEENYIFNDAAIGKGLASNHAGYTHT